VRRGAAGVERRRFENCASRLGCILGGGIVMCVCVCVVVPEGSGRLMCGDVQVRSSAAAAKPGGRSSAQTATCWSCDTVTVEMP
jgi:hypothetical protein